MKKGLLISIILTLTFVLIGCNKKDDSIDYAKAISIPAFLEVAIEEVPYDLSTLLTIENYDVITNISFDTEKVNFDQAGDYAIVISVDFTDKTTKSYNSVLRLTNRSDIGYPQIIGVKNRLISPTNETVDFLEGIAFTDSSKIVNSGVIGTINLQKEGLYTLTYYAEDDDGNYTTSSCFVVVSSNLFFYNHFINQLGDVPTDKLKYVRDYSILYSAVYANNKSQIFNTLNYYGNFLSPANFEELLGRNLRVDEKESISQVQKLFRLNEYTIYEDLYNDTLSTTDKEYFERAYEIYTNYASNTAINAIKTTHFIAHTEYSELQSVNATSLNAFDIAALDKYKEFTKLSLDSMYLEITQNTSYEFDTRIRDIENISHYTHIINEFNKTNILSDHSQIINKYSDNEKLFAEIYSEYYKFKSIYQISIYLQEKGYTTISINEIENTYNLLKTVIEAYEGENLPLIEQNILDLEELIVMQNASFSEQETTSILFFIEAFDMLYENPFDSIKTVYSEAMANEIISAYKTVYKMDLYRNNLKLLESGSYELLKVYLGRDLTNEELTSIDIYRKYNLSDTPLNFMEVVSKYNLSTNEIEEFLSYYENPSPDVELSGRLPYLLKFEMIYTFSIEEYQVVEDLVALFVEKEIPLYMFERLIVSNRFDVINENYDYDFTESEYKIIENYIMYISKVIQEKFELEREDLLLEYFCGNTNCDYYLSVIYDELYPSYYLTNNYFLNVSNSLFKRLTLKDMSPEYNRAMEELGPIFVEVLIYKDYLKKYSNDDIIITEDNLNYFITFYNAILDISGFIPEYKIAVQNRFLFNLNAQEEEAFIYIANLEIQKENQAHKGDVLSKIEQYGFYSYLESYSRIFDLIQENNIRITPYRSELNSVRDLDLNETDVNHLEKTIELFDAISYYERHYVPMRKDNIYYEPLTIDEIIFAVRSLRTAGYHYSLSADYYAMFYSNPEAHQDYYNLSEETRVITEKFIEMIRINSYLEDLEFVEDYFPEELHELVSKAYLDLFFKLDNAGEDFLKKSQNNLEGLPLSLEEEFLFGLYVDFVYGPRTMAILDEPPFDPYYGKPFLLEYVKIGINMKLDNDEYVNSIEKVINAFDTGFNASYDELRLAFLYQNDPLIKLQVYFDTIDRGVSLDINQYETYINMDLLDARYIFKEQTLAYENGEATEKDLLESATQFLGLLEIEDYVDIIYLYNPSIEFTNETLIDPNVITEIANEIVFANTLLQQQYLYNVSLNESLEYPFDKPYLLIPNPEDYHPHTDFSDLYRQAKFLSSFEVFIEINEAWQHEIIIQDFGSSILQFVIHQNDFENYFGRPLTETEVIELRHSNQIVVRHQLLNRIDLRTLSLSDQKELPNLFDFFIETSEMHMSIMDYLSFSGTIENVPTSNQLDILFKIEPPYFTIESKYFFYRINEYK